MEDLGNPYVTLDGQAITAERRCDATSGRFCNMDLCPSTSGADVQFGSCLSNHSHGELQPEESMDVCSSDAVPEIQNSLHNGFCSPDCSVCRDITQMIGISSCQETNPIPVPPVVLVGRAPDASVINQWPPFGCRGTERI